MMRFLLGTIALLLGVAVLRSDDTKKPKDQKPAPTVPSIKLLVLEDTKDKSDEKSSTSVAKQKYDELIKQYRKAQTDYFTAIRAAKGDEDKIKAAQEKAPKPEKYAKELFDLAKKYPKDPVAIDALNWIMIFAHDTNERREALDLIEKDYLDDPKIAQVCQVMAGQESPQATSFLHMVLDKSKSHDAQGQAAYALGLQVKKRADAAREEKKTDAAKLDKEAEGYFEKVVADFADVKYRRTSTLGAAAKGQLFEMNHLQVGMVAPNIQAEDIEGKKMQLSDFRGKVVLLDFWGNW